MNLSKAHTESLLRTVILVQNTSQSGHLDVYKSLQQGSVSAK